MKNLVFVLGMLVFSLPVKAQFFDKLADKAVDAATNSIEKKVEEKSTEYTEKAADAVFEPIDKKTEKKDRKDKKDEKKEEIKRKSDSGSQSSSASDILITQPIFEQNAIALTTNDIPDLDKAGKILSANPGMRAIISAHVMSDEDATDLSEFRGMLLKTILVRKFELNEDFISLEINEPGSPNDRNVEIKFQ